MVKLSEGEVKYR